MFEDYQPYKNPTLAGVILPSVKIDQRHYDALEIPNTTSNYDFLRKLCWRGIQEKGIDKLPNAKEYYERVKKELAVFQETTFVDYVLLNWDVHTFCRENDIVTGWGRGSAAGSLVFYLIGVTKDPIDPIKYELYFERFLSAVRAKKIEFEGKTYIDGGSLCDVDSDISYLERHRVIEYIESRYPSRNAKILTLGTLGSKAVITECAKIVQGLNKDEAKAISDTIPKVFNVPMDIKDALKESEKFLEYSKKHPKLFEVAKKLEGLIKNTGIHASGIAVSCDEIGELMPLQVTQDAETKEKAVTTGYEMGDVGSLCVKLDILGLKTLSIVKMTCDSAGIKLSEIPLEEEETYKFLQNLYAPQGLFQIETKTGFEVCKKIKPRNLHDLAAILALSRPGALSFVDKYAEFIKTGESQSVHPFFDSILGRTGSIPIFQEQLMNMISKIGFSLNDADAVRKCVGKKKVEEMKTWKQKIYDKTSENNLEESIADITWKVAEDSANYSFCAGHSFPYSFLSYVTAYLKTHHLKHFYCASLNVAAQGDSKKAIKKLAAISRETILFNMKVLPPDFSKSKIKFTIEGDNIRYGWTCVKGVSEKTIEPLLSFCDKEISTKYDIFMEAKSCGLPIGTLCSFIRAGCMDSFGENRSSLVLEAQVFNKLTEKEKIRAIEFGPRHNYNILAALKEIGEGKLLDEKGKPVISEKRIATLRKEYVEFKKIYDQNHKYKEFANWFFENKLLGYSYSYNLRQVFQEPENNFTPILGVKSFDDNTQVKIVGTVEECFKRRSQKNNNYMRMIIADETGTIDAMLGDSPKEKKLEKWLENNKQPEEGQIVILVGKKNKDTIFIDKLTIMDEIIAFNKKDLKE